MSRIELGRRLRDLRLAAGLTQGELAGILRPTKPPSPSLISSWEKVEGKAFPTSDWLRGLAMTYAVEARPGAESLPQPHQLSTDQRNRYETLLAELMQLLGGTSGSAPDEDESRFWQFGDRLPIRIIGSTVPVDWYAGAPFGDPRHPDHDPLLRHAEAQAELELYGHLMRENPESDVQVVVSADAGQQDLLGHVVLLGGGTLNAWSDVFSNRMGLQAVAQDDPDVAKGSPGSPDVVTDERRLVLGAGDEVQVLEPVFEPSPREGLPRPLYDMALIARQPNPFNPQATVTLMYGLYGKGTLGAARTFVQQPLAEANEAYRRREFGVGPVRLVTRILLAGDIVWPPSLEQDRLDLDNWPQG